MKHHLCFKIASCDGKIKVLEERKKETKKQKNSTNRRRVNAVARAGIWAWIGLGLWLGICLPGVIWISSLPHILNYGNGPPYIYIYLRFGGFSLSFLQMWAWVVVLCGWLGTELNPPSLLLAPTYTFLLLLLSFPLPLSLPFPPPLHSPPSNYWLFESLYLQRIENKLQVLSSFPPWLFVI